MLLHIGKLEAHLTVRDLEQVFKEYGKIKKLEMGPASDGTQTAWVWVEDAVGRSILHHAQGDFIKGCCLRIEQFITGERPSHKRRTAA